METTYYLRDYLSPGGKHPYAQLPVDMEKALASGHDVFVLSVPGFLMASGHPELKDHPWSDCDTQPSYYENAKDCIDRKNGQISEL